MSTRAGEELFIPFREEIVAENYFVNFLVSIYDI